MDGLGALAAHVELVRSPVVVPGSRLALVPAAPRSARVHWLVVTVPAALTLLGISWLIAEDGAVSELTTAGAVLALVVGGIGTYGWRQLRMATQVPGRRWRSSTIQYLGPFEGDQALPGARGLASVHTNERVTTPACHLVLTDAGFRIIPTSPPWKPQLELPWAELRTIEVHEGDDPLLLLVRRDGRWAATTARFDLALVTELRRFGISEA